VSAQPQRVHAGVPRRRTPAAPARRAQHQPHDPTISSILLTGAMVIKRVSVVQDQRRMMENRLSFICVLSPPLRASRVRSGSRYASHVLLVRPSGFDHQVYDRLVVERRNTSTSRFRQHLREPGALLRQEAGILLFDSSFSSILVRDVQSPQEIFTPMPRSFSARKKAP